MSLFSILIIDDNEEDRYLLKRQIKKANLTNKVYEAENGRVALEFLKEYEKNAVENPGKFPPQLIFLDINMPIMGGFEFLEKYAELKEGGPNDYKSTIVTMITSSEREEDKQKSASYNFVAGFIVKMPESPEDLKVIIQKCFPEVVFD